jgi:hypothetical protein
MRVSYEKGVATHLGPSHAAAAGVLLVGQRRSSLCTRKGSSEGEQDNEDAHHREYTAPSAHSDDRAAQHVMLADERA